MYQSGFTKSDPTMKIVIWILFATFGCQIANGHGEMYYPTPWHATSVCSSENSPHDCKFEMKVTTNCTGRCSRSAGSTAWFTNYTFIPGEATLPEDMYDDWLGKTGTHGVGLHPWNAPGTSPTYGNGCGANGGNPFGCDGEDDVYGRCCGGGSTGGGCGGYANGWSALDHYEDGFFGNPKETKWTRGEPAEVLWTSGAYHRGGYAYRLCRVHNQKYWKVTEECFQQGHLNFAGKTSWIYWKPNNEHFYPDGWMPIELKTTRIGTTPEGSEWAKVNLPKRGSTHDSWAFKDLVEVPETLDPGHYVLSFRWDCQQSPQVWNACANIKIV